MTGRARRALAIAGVLAYVGLGVAALAAGLLADAAPGDRAALERALRGQAAFLTVAGLLLLAGLGVIVGYFLRRYADPARRLAAETQIIATANPAHRLDVRRPVELAELAAAVNGLAERLEAAERDVARQIAEAGADLERERNRLAALMAELARAVLVCNADGRILLYNAAARSLAEASSREGLGGSSHQGTSITNTNVANPNVTNTNVANPSVPNPSVPNMVGLGRSVFSIVDRGVIAHALEQIGDTAAPSYEAVAPLGDRLLRVHVAAVEGASGATAGGFVLLLEDVTRPARAGRLAAELLRSLTESARASAGNVRAAAESILDYPDMAPEQRRRFAEIIREEAASLGVRVARVLRESSGLLEDQWALADMHARDLLAALARALVREHALPATVTEPDESLWLRVDSYAVIRSVGEFAGRLQAERGVQEVRLALAEAGGHAALDVRWAGPVVDAETARRWLARPAAAGSLGAGGLRQVADRHGGEVWCQADPDGGGSRLRVLLPIAAGDGPGAAVRAPRRGSPPGPEVPSRPEFYDFDLFERIGQESAWDDRRLDELTWTVFDTETTGLFPDQGDEIIAIGAVRIVNGRLLREETFDQLVDPRRTVPMQSQQIHGIRPELLRGQPVLEEVLPAFARFAEDTVLVGHNVAFDMRFLRRKEQQAGVRLTQPVLDTLLLSAAAHPNHEEHSLEAIAARLGVSVLGRHTALGDAVLTGEIFLRLVRILGEQGVLTLGAAREAARRTYQARVSDKLYT
jgi:DNA polymerase-3 subunit epsilon